MNLYPTIRTAILFASCASVIAAAIRIALEGVGRPDVGMLFAIWLMLVILVLDRRTP